MNERIRQLEANIKPLPRDDKVAALERALHEHEETIRALRSGESQSSSANQAEAEEVQHLLEDTPPDTPAKQGATGQLAGKLAHSPEDKKAYAEIGRRAGILGAKSGHLGGKTGAEFGHLGGQFGCRGGRKRKLEPESDDEQPAASRNFRAERLKAAIQPKRRELKAASVKQFREFCMKKLAEAGLQESDMTLEWMSENIRKRHFREKKNRELWRVWENKPKADRVEELELGAKGGNRKQGEHHVKRQHLGLGIRNVPRQTGNRKSALWSVFEQVHQQFNDWRMGGQYVDKDDLNAEFDYRLEQKIEELQKKKELEGSLSLYHANVLTYALRRKASHMKSWKARNQTCEQMQKLFRCRFLKPQRLIHVSLEQECKRLCESWQYWDYSMWLACFAEEEELASHVIQPEKFRANVKNMVIAMSDQLPFWIKLVPGKQLYMKGEFATSKKGLSAKEKVEARGSRGGGGSQKKDSNVYQQTLEAEGMTQTRGSSNSEQDKFRITVDVEQVCFGYFDDKQKPVADHGITSVVFTGAHFNELNVDRDRRWIETDTYTVDGKEKVCRAGEPIPAGLGKSLLDFREKCPELYKDMKDLNFRFYQQPAGFEDSVITKWKIKEQAKVHGQVLALRDLFGGALSESSRDTMFLCQQLCSWIRSKITAICQVADTHVIRPIKIRKLQKDIALRRELINLSKHEETPVIFKCGMYEIMRTLYQTISELKKEWFESQYLLKAMFQNGWLSMRPNYTSKRLERTEEQAWAKDLKFGSHRLQQSWCDMRFDHFNSENVPQTTSIEIKEGETDDTEQTYSCQPGDKRSLNCWKKMLEAGEITTEELAAFRDEPWFEMEVQNFEGLDGLEDCKHLMMTPTQRRHELGIDQYLTSQRNDIARQQHKKRSKQLSNLARQPTN